MSYPTYAIVPPRSGFNQPARRPPSAPAREINKATEQGARIRCPQALKLPGIPQRLRLGPGVNWDTQPAQLWEAQGATCWSFSMEVKPQDLGSRTGVHFCQIQVIIVTSLRTYMNILLGEMGYPQPFPNDYSFGKPPMKKNTWNIWVLEIHIKLICLLVPLSHQSVIMAWRTHHDPLTVDLLTSKARPTPWLHGSGIFSMRCLSAAWSPHWSPTTPWFMLMQVPRSEQPS